MVNVDLTEKRFEHDIEAYLLDHGYEQFSYQDENSNWVYKHSFDASKFLYLDVLFYFINIT